MKQSVQLRYFIHSGYISTSGYYFDLSLIPEQTARSRIVAHWVVGAQVFRSSDNNLILILPQAQLIDATEAPGFPLVQIPGHKIFSSFPISNDLIPNLSASAGESVVLAKAGKLVTQSLTAPEELSQWIDLSAFTITEPRSLGTATTPELKIKVEQFDPRSKFEGVPPAADDLNHLIDELAKARSADHGNSSAQDSHSPFTNFLKELFSSFNKPEPNGGSVPRKTAQQGVKPVSAKPSVQSVMANLKFNAFIAKVLSFTGLLSVIQAKQAAYLSKMMELLTRADWSEALKYAIPLAQDGSSPQGIAFGILTPRDMLDFSFRPPVPGPSLNLESELVVQLRLLYRRAHEQLAASGKIDEAAYVLAELLQAHAEAVNFLERHGRFQLAAELAESRKLSNEVVIRLWVLAGNIERAIYITRLTGAFAAAVALLEQNNPKFAPALRTYWAQRLAEQGNFAQAAEVIWSVPGYSELCNAWIKLELENGGAASGQLLARQLIRDPRSIERWRPLIEVLLDACSREQAATRLAFLDTLLSQSRSRSAELNGMLKQATRAILSDVAEGYVHLTKAELRKIINASQDMFLAVDITGAPLPETIANLRNCGSTPKLTTIEKGDAGLNPVLDAAYCNNGNSWIALGEAGVLLLGKDGRRLHHFMIPAQHFVVSDSGNRIIAVADRGEAKRLTQIDTASGAVTDLGEILLSTFARTFDGSLWVAAYKEELNVLEVTNGSLKTLWRMPGLTKNIIAIGRNDNQCSFITSGIITKDAVGRPITPAEVSERWLCDYLDLQLRNRLTVGPAPQHTQFRRIVSPQGIVVDLILEGKVDGSKKFGAYYNSNRIIKELDTTTCVDLNSIGVDINEDWIALTVQRDYGCECILMLLRERKVVMRVKLKGSGSASPRLQENTLSICDDRGRLLIYDLKYGSIIRNLRIT